MRRAAAQCLGQAKKHENHGPGAEGTGTTAEDTGTTAEDASTTTEATGTTAEDSTHCLPRFAVVWVSVPNRLGAPGMVGGRVGGRVGVAVVWVSLSLSFGCVSRIGILCRVPGLPVWVCVACCCWGSLRTYGTETEHGYPVLGEEQHETT